MLVFVDYFGRNNIFFIRWTIALSVESVIGGAHATQWLVRGKLRSVFAGECEALGREISGGCWKADVTQWALRGS